MQQNSGLVDDQLIFNKAGKQIQWEKSFQTNVIESTGYPHGKDEHQPLTHPVHKI